MGTRFLATPEANAHAEYKAKLVAASEGQTVRTIIAGTEMPIHRFVSIPPNARSTGDIESMALLLDSPSVWYVKSGPLLTSFVRQSPKLSI